MDKRREIPGGIGKSDKPNAAPRADVERVSRRVDALGLDVHEAVAQAGISRMTGYRLINGEASVGTLRKLEEWVVREENKRGSSTMTKSAETELMAEWARLGEELHDADPTRFANALDAIRDMLASVKLQQRAFAKMFRATPGNER